MTEPSRDDAAPPAETPALGPRHKWDRLLAPALGSLRDAHVHLAQHGSELAAVRLEAAHSIDECLGLVASAAMDLPADAWVVARGARVESWVERRYPSAAQLEEAGGGRPVLVASFDHHAGAVSTTALARIGLSRGADDPEGGLIERDDRGEPTGVLLEAAFKLALAAMPEPTEDDVRRWLRAGARDFAARGFAEVHDMMIAPVHVRLLGEMDRAGELPARVRGYATPQVFEPVRDAFADLGQSERVAFGGLKLFVDGTLNSRTAFMLEPYAEPIASHPRGTPLLSEETIAGWFDRAGNEGFDVAAHAIGDAAVRRLLDVYERAASGADPRFSLRIEHAEFVDEEDVPRFAALSRGGRRVIASPQPCHLLADIEAIGRLTPGRAHRAFPLRDLADAADAAGFRPADLVWLGSDAPVVPPEPRDNLQAAVHRCRAEPACPRIAEDQSIGPATALSMMTA